MRQTRLKATSRLSTDIPRQTEVGKFVVWYSWLVLPFIQRMQALVWQYGSFVASRRRQSKVDDKTHEAIILASEQGRSRLGQSTNISEYRQIKSSSSL